MPKKQQLQPFWWFRGASVAQLLTHLRGVGPECRLEVHLDGDTMTLVVVPEATGPTEAGGVTGESHRCPPETP